MNAKHYFLLLIACVGLSSCASPANSEAMTPTGLALRNKFSKSVSLAVSGGQKTNPLWTSQVDNKSFQTALKNAIERNHVFTRVIEAEGGDYVLDVRLVRLQQPLIGLNMTVTSETEWQLSKGGAKVWGENIRTPYTATVGQAFAGVKRLRLANEGSIQANIRAGLEKISRLSL